MSYRTYIISLLFVLNLNAYHAAGVLPFYADKDGKIWLMLGKSTVHNNKVSDFGGLKDKEDNEDAYVTAAREGCEELLFALDEESSFARILQLRKKYGKHDFNLQQAQSLTHKKIMTALNSDLCFPVTSHGYNMHFITFKPDTCNTTLFTQGNERLSSRKSKFKGTLPHCWNETAKFIFVTIDELFDAIDQQYTCSYDHVYLKNHDCYLYEPFIESMLKAREQGIIAQLQQRFKQ